MSDNRGPDPFLVELLREAAPEDHAVLARLFGEADHIARHLPMHAVPGVTRAAWLQFVALHAVSSGDPYAVTLVEVARRALVEVAGAMEVLVTRAPNDARELD